MLGRYEARKDFESSTHDRVIVIAAAELYAAKLHHSEPAPLRAVFRVELLQKHDAVCDALHLKVTVRGSQVIEQHDRTVPACKKLLEGENLPAVAKRIAG